MPFARKVVLALIAVGVLPALVSGVFSYRASREELVSSIGGAHQTATTEAANSLDDAIRLRVETVRLLLQAIPFASLPKSELRDVLLIPARQTRGLAALAALDESGDAVVQPLVVPLEGRTPVNLGELARHIPLAAALSSGAAVGAPYHLDDGVPRLAAAFRVQEKPALVVAVELVLDETISHLDELSTGGGAAWLFGPDGELFASARAVAGAAEQNLGRHPNAAKEAVLLQRANAEWLAASAPVGQLGWTLVHEVSADQAFRPAQRLLRHSMLWAATALVLMLALGWALARAVTRPVQQLSAAAQALSAGDYTQRATVETRDELGRFAEAFNNMAVEIQRRDGEIRTWNEQLQVRVDERTRELEDARGQIERSRRLAGLAALGAGVSHELNNPVMAVLGCIDLAREELPKDSPQQELLDMAREGAMRIADIGRRVRELVEAQAGPGRPFQLSFAVERAVDALKPFLVEGNCTVRLDTNTQDTRVLGRLAEVQEAVAHLLRNAIAAMPRGGEVVVTVSAVADALKLTVRDAGVGIAPENKERIFDPFFTTKPTGTEVGMGLTLVHRIVEAHGGRITVDSAPGKGSTFTLFFPRGETDAHLA